MGRYILAHDLGTSGNKATLFTTDGDLVASVVRPYETKYFNINWAEQNPKDWWKAVKESTSELIKNVDAQEIGVVCFSGQMMGCVCVDKKGRPLRNAIIYCDQRAEKEAGYILNKIDAHRFYEITGHRASPSYSGEKLMWVKNNEPDIYADTYKMLNAKDFINYKLTGEFYTDFSDASGTNLFDLCKLDWSEQLVNISEIEPSKLPRAVPSTNVLGKITKDASDETGLPEGIPVVAGAGDGVCAGVGVGSVKAGTAYNYLGTSSWIALTTDEPLLDPEQRTFVWAHAVPGLYHPTGTMQTAGGSFNWLKQEICRWETQNAILNNRDPFDEINDVISNSVPGSRGILFLPYLLGERSPRWNPQAKGGFIGITMGHKRADILRSVVEGVLLNLSIILDIFRKNIKIEEMFVIGGCAKGDIWRQMMADIYNAKIIKPNYLEEATSMGAGIIGGVGSGIFEDFNVINRFLTVDTAVEPIAQNVDVYNIMKPIFNDCYKSLETVFRALSGLKYYEK